MGTKRESEHCDACGPEQASHGSLWLSSTTDIWTQALPVHRLPFYSLLNRLGETATSALGRIGFHLFRALGAITLTADTGTAVNRRSRLLWEEALRRGIPMEQLLFFGNATDTFRVRRNDASVFKNHFFKSLPLTPPGDALRMDDKFLFKESMRKAGLPVPRSYSASDFKSAARALRELEVVCVKPRSGSNGRHTYPYVRNEDDLKSALASAKQICAYISVEEHLEGNLSRATCVEGSMVGFLESYYPTVTGDSASTVAQLVAKANGARLDGVSEIVMDSSYRGYINRRGYDLDSVLPEGQALQLSYRAGAGAGGSNREHGRNIHPSFIGPIEAAAKLTGLHIVGFDLIIPDVQQPADSQKWGFVEANSLPWIDLHAGPFYGEPIDLAPAVWDLWQGYLGAAHPAAGIR